MLSFSMYSRRRRVGEPCRADDDEKKKGRVESRSRMKSSFLILFIIIFLPLFALDGCAFSGSSSESKNDNGSKDVARFCGWSTNAPCLQNYDCIVSGCSNQVCQGANEPPALSTCEWTDCFDAEKFSMACGCVEGKCKWFERGNQ